MEAQSTALAAIRTSLLSLADFVASAQLRIPRPETSRIERTRDEVAWAIREYLVPRLDDPLAPAVAVVAGPGGTGKSAILNAIARRPLSESGVMRPTTTEPIVWASRSRPDSDWKAFLHRLREQTGAELDVVMSDDPLIEHVIFVDTPPVDFVRSDGRMPALEALGLADICIFVTSASRYADAAGWMYLEAARRRGVPILHVINRLPRDAETAEEVLVDYVARLHGRDLLIEPNTALVFPVVAGEIDDVTEGPSPAAVDALRGELAELAHSDFRSAIINQTVLATTQAVAQRARRVGAELAVEVQERADFDEVVVSAYQVQSDALAADLDAGRFAELANAESWGLAAADLTGIVTRRAGIAAQQAAQSWESRPGGRELLAAGGDGLRRHGQDTAYEAQRLLEQWYTVMGEHAATASKRGKLWKRTQRRVLRRLWPQVLDPDRTVDGSLTRRYGTKAANLVADGRLELAETLTAALAADAGRFDRFLGPQPNADILREIETRAEWIEALVEDEVELVPIVSSSSAADTEDAGSPAAAPDTAAGAESDRVDEPVLESDGATGEQIEAPAVESGSVDLDPTDPSWGEASGETFQAMPDDVVVVDATGVDERAEAVEIDTPHEPEQALEPVDEDDSVEAADLGVPHEPASPVRGEVSDEPTERDAPVDADGPPGPENPDGSEIPRGSDGSDEDGETSDLDADDATNGSSEPSSEGQGERSEIGDA
jgi:hypothetical protein